MVQYIHASLQADITYPMLSRSSFLYRLAGGINGSSILTSMGFMIGVISALVGLVIILSLALVVVILCRCGKNCQQEKGELLDASMYI